METRVFQANVNKLKTGYSFPSVGIRVKNITQDSRVHGDKGPAVKGDTEVSCSRQPAASTVGSAHFSHPWTEAKDK